MSHLKSLGVIRSFSAEILAHSRRRWFQPSVQRKASLGGRLAMPINQRLSAACDKVAIVAKAKAYGIRTVPEKTVTLDCENERS